MKRLWPAVLAVLLAACGVEPSGVTDGGEAPSGVAAGPTLYFVDEHHELRPHLSRTGHLGTISGAMSLLLSGPAGSELHNEIVYAGTTPIVVSTSPGVIQLRVPFTGHQVSPLGVDQLVCTALAVHVQRGGSRSTKVRVIFTLADEGQSDRLRTCPLIR